MFNLFNALLAPFVPALWLYTLHRRFVRGKSAASYRGQWGHITPRMRAFGRGDGPKIWLHAVSVGETMAARPLARALRTRMPDAKIVLSSTTDTGHEVARSAVQAGEADLAIYFPLDLPFVVRRVLNALRPNAIGFVETELWPNLLHLARRRGIATFQLNGRVSDNLLKSAPRLGPLWKWMIGNIGQFQMRGEGDAARLRLLGVGENKIVVVGDVKLEAPPVSSDELRNKWRGELGLGDADRLLICGSTHAGEEAMILAAADALPRDWRVAIAPRHIERTDEVVALVEARGWKVARRSRGDELVAPNRTPASNRDSSESESLEADARPTTSTIYLLDTVGELADFYAAGDIAFVGGSLISRGGHNVLEPVLRGAPVFFGPHMMNFRAAAELVINNELGAQIEDGGALIAAAKQWMATGNRDEFAARVEAALSSHRGAAARAAQLVAQVTSESIPTAANADEGQG